MMATQPDHSAPSSERRWRFGRAVRIVAWSLLGLRNSTRHGQDQEGLHPLAIVFVGLGAVVALVLVLMAIVHWVT